VLVIVSSRAKVLTVFSRLIIYIYVQASDCGVDSHGWILSPTTNDTSPPICIDRTGPASACATAAMDTYPWFFTFSGRWEIFKADYESACILRKQERGNCPFSGRRTAPFLLHFPGLSWIMLLILGFRMITPIKSFVLDMPPTSLDIGQGRWFSFRVN
jgi:hypothetical protein